MGRDSVSLSARTAFQEPPELVLSLSLGPHLVAGFRHEDIHIKHFMRLVARFAKHQTGPQER